ncbi:MAG: ribosome small subunit-dependent GTPase A [Actinomycetia bacterium]|nr:ribosome small subunit-dependent GTPase A [Actinomycetes bacterium]MCP5033596.1 ribosome small subunit-dependent GTPase A [Actinomycetes bacterium]
MSNQSSSGPAGPPSTSTIDDLVELTPDLASLGWNEELDAWADETVIRTGIGTSEGEVVRGRIARVSRGFSLVFTGGAALLAASGSNRAVLDLVPATGDFVVVRNDPEDGPSIAAIAPRRSALQRRAPGRVPEAQVLAANADTVFVMHGLDRDMNLRRIERMLVVSWDSGAEPVVVLTKADLDPDVSATLEQVQTISAGVEVLAISTVADRDLDRVQSLLDDNQSVALLGPSGVGKSTLVNFLSDGVVQLTGEVRAADHRGRHTTVTRDLIPLPGGGFIIDAPGIREIGLWQAYDGLAKAFPEIAEAAASCRFADCDHVQEPGCGVTAAMADGAIVERRLQHWRELSAELELQETQLTEFARRAESRNRADAEDQRDRTRSNRKGRSSRRRRGPKR